MKFKWPYLFWTGVIFTFILFPVFLLDVGLTTMLETHTQIKKNEAFSKIEKKLEQVTQYSDGRYYYHAVLNKILHIANQQKDPYHYLNKAQSNLKEVNDNGFTFITWNNKGQVVDELTDETAYRYAMRTTYNVLKAVFEDSEENYPGAPETIAIVKQRLNLVRAYLGGFLVPEKLNLPLMAGGLAECILAGSNPAKSYFWYGIGEEVSFLAFINNELVTKPTNLPKLVASMNKASENSDLQKHYGYFDISSLNYDDIIPELRVALAKFENYSAQDLETENYLVSIRVFSPDTRVFCYIPKSKILVDANNVYSNLMVKLVLLLVAICIGLLWLFIKKNTFISIKWKLALLFIYANGLPLMILGFTGFEYLSQKKSILLENAYVEMYNLFEDFDGRFNKIKADYSGEFNELIDELNLKTTPLTSKDINKIHALARNYKAYDSIVSSNSRKKGLLDIPYEKRRQSASFWHDVFDSLLEYLEYKDYSPQEIFASSEFDTQAGGGLKIDNVLLHKFLHKARGISSEKLGQEDFEYYWNLIGNFEEKDFDYAITVMWNLEGLQEEYLKNNIEELNYNFADIQCFARIFTNGINFSKDGKSLTTVNSIDNLLRQTTNLAEIRQKEVVYNNEKFVAFGILGKALDRVALVGLYPVEKMNSVLRSIFLKLLAFAVLSLILVSGIAMGLSKQFISPISEIEKGIYAISKQNYRFRTPIKTADEFGELGVAFNTAIESLEELEVAKIVQENLFPTDTLAENNIKIFGRSITMTHLGGDYFDYFSLDSPNIGVLMGDVSGHGVPAALVMAAAKATVLMAEDSRLVPEELLTKIHVCLREINRLKIKRMMTTSYLLLDSITGEFKMANAGHCFPILITNKGSEVNYLEFKGSFPLGIVRRPRLSSVDHQLTDGDILLLYTDGIIEAPNEKGESLGFERFATLLKKAYSPDIEEYYDNIFNQYLEWAPESDDDLTMVLIKYEK